MPRLSEYEPIVGKEVVEELKLLSKMLEGKSVQHVNSTGVGGGVAEILIRMVPLMQELGINAQWDVIRGGNQFFQATKKFHNALHGQKEAIGREMFDVFLKTSRKNLEEMNFCSEIVIIHDPQPIVLIEKKKEMKGKWVWRCHIDVAYPDKHVWSFLEKFIHQYDAAVFSAPVFSHKLPIRQFLISPSIDPLSDKNRELPEKVISRVLKKYHIDRGKPILTQVSRFDHLKDPLGVIEVFRMVRKYNDCQLILAGNKADDDPESDKVLAEVREKAGNDPDIHILIIPPETNDIDINALQRTSDVILQKSIREGFGLVVTEALWKGKPVVASAVGGIPLQIKHKYSGMLCRSAEGASFAVKQLLNSPEYARELGKNAREHIRQNFLLTRHLRDYLLLFLALYHEKDVVYL